MRKTLALVAALVLVPFALAGDDPIDPKAVAEAYVDGEPALRAEAEKVAAGASADLLRKILAEVAELARAERPLLAMPPPEFAPAPRPPPVNRPSGGSSGAAGDAPWTGPTPEYGPVPPRPRGGVGPMVGVEMRFLNLSEATAERLGFARTSKPGSRVLDEGEVARLLAAVGKDAGATLVTAPRIGVRDRQRADVSMTTPFQYVQDYDLEVAGGTPLLATLQEGVKASVRAGVIPDLGSVLIDVSFTVAEVVRPVPVLKTSLGMGKEKEFHIQLPEVRTVQRTLRVPVVSGTTVVLDTWSQVVPVTKDGATTEGRRVGVALLETDIFYVAPEPAPAPAPR